MQHLFSYATRFLPFEHLFYQWNHISTCHYNLYRRYREHRQLLDARENTVKAVEGQVQDFYNHHMQHKIALEAIKDLPALSQQLEQQLEITCSICFHLLSDFCPLSIFSINEIISQSVTLIFIIGIVSTDSCWMPERTRWKQWRVRCRTSTTITCSTR